MTHTNDGIARIVKATPETRAGVVGFKTTFDNGIEGWCTKEAFDTKMPTDYTYDEIQEILS